MADDDDPMAGVDAGETVKFETTADVSAWGVAPDELFGRDRDGDRRVADVEIVGDAGDEDIVVTYEAQLEKEPVPAIRKRSRRERRADRPRWKKALSVAVPFGIATAAMGIGLWITNLALGSLTINGDRVGAVTFWDALPVVLLIILIAIVAIIGPRGYSGRAGR